MITTELPEPDSPKELKDIIDEPGNNIHMQGHETEMLLRDQELLIEAERLSMDLEELLSDTDLRVKKLRPNEKYHERYLIK